MQNISIPPKTNAKNITIVFILPNYCNTFSIESKVIYRQYFKKEPQETLLWPFIFCDY